MGKYADDVLAVADAMSEKVALITRQEIKIESLEARCRALESQLQEEREQREMWQAAALAMSAKNTDLLHQMQTMQRLIFLSVKKVKAYFSRMTDVNILALLRDFVEYSLPDDISSEFRCYVLDVIRVQLPKPEPTQVINVAGNNYNVHDNETVNA